MAAQKPVAAPQQNPYAPFNSTNKILLGCIGKPSAGKSSFLNAATSAQAKVGNYPFTTIDPNHGVASYATPCPCAKYNLQNMCAPRYGRCEAGIRYIPVQVLDVAGLIPGASEGRGLGNKFLNDLSHAKVLMHVVDVSGTTNEKGENTVGYDPLLDIEWLRQEIHCWIFQNLWSKWGSIVRRHIATKSNLAETLQNQFSGYGSKIAIIYKVLEKLGLKDPVDIEAWNEDMVHKLVDQFMNEQFPTILILNKCDMEGADKNISRICEKYGEDIVVPASALAECFLRKMAQSNYIRYQPGSNFFETAEDIQQSNSAQGPPLKPLDPVNKKRLEKIQDLVLFRYGHTGVQEAIKVAVDQLHMIPIYVVNSLKNFNCGEKNGKVFRNCMLIPSGTTVKELCQKIFKDRAGLVQYVECVGGTRLGDEEVLTIEKNIIKFVLGATSNDNE